MKIAPMLIFLYIIMAGIILFDSIADVSSPTLNPYNLSVLENATDPESDTTAGGAFWSIFWNPTQLENSGFIALLVTALFISGGIAVAITALTKSDISLLTPVFITLVTAGVFPILALWQVINREIWAWSILTEDCCSGAQIEAGEVLANGVTCAEGVMCFPATLFTGLIVGPIVVFWFLACFEWLSARPMT